MKKQALLIGINKYDLLGDLLYARQDAEAIAEMLCKHCGFNDSEITLMRCTSSGATRATARFIEYAMSDLTGYRDLDLLIFGFWGHGFAPRPGKRYLCGIDSVEKDLERTAVSLDLAKAKLAQVGALNTLLILDCCQNRPAGRSAGAAVLEKGAELQLASMARDIQAAHSKEGSIERMPTVAIMNSCCEGQKAYEWDDRKHGVFTAHLLDGIKSGKTSIARLSTFVCDRTPLTVRKLHREEQIPWFTIEGRGDIQLSEKTGKSIEQLKIADVTTKPAVKAIGPKKPAAKVSEVSRFVKNKKGLWAVLILVVVGAITVIAFLDNQKDQTRTSSSKPKSFSTSLVKGETTSRTANGSQQSKHGNVITNSIGMKLVCIPAGEFMMGSPSTEKDRGDDEVPQHMVRISKAFYMSKTEVTQSQFKTVMNSEPWSGMNFVQQSDDNPAVYVSWDDAVKFCEELSLKEGKTYRLPTEAQWEYACRAETTTRFNFGDTESSLGEYAWFDGNAWGVGEKYAHTVGQKKPNALGLHDMHGNIFEWCRDWYDSGYYGKAGDVVIDPENTQPAQYRVLRGGCFSNGPGQCRSADRFKMKPDDRFNGHGFRVVLEIETSESDKSTEVSKVKEQKVRAKTSEVKEVTEIPLAEATFGAAKAIQLQQQTASYLGVSVKKKVDLGSGIEMELVLIPAGEFKMGSRDSAATLVRKYGGEQKDFADEHPQHRVKISKCFYMGVTEVTQAQWKSVMGTTVNQQKYKADPPLPLRGEGPDYPMYYVSWEETMEFCRKLSQKRGERYRLPTEAEWEFACRAGTETPFYFGYTLTKKQANLDGGVTGSNMKVSSYPANAFGLYDMHGNVWEWCSDWYDESYYSNSPSINPKNTRSGTSRVLRGGGWPFSSQHCRSAKRNWTGPDLRFFFYGFRVVMEIERGKE